MKILVALLCFTAISIPAHAYKGCKGKVTAVMDHPSYCDTNYAFYLDVTGGNSGPPVCSLSSLSDTLVLTAYVSSKNIYAALDISKDSDCGSVAAYSDPSLINIED